MCPLTYLPYPFTRILLPRLNWLLSDEFLIVGLAFGVEILRGCSSPYKFFRMLLLISIGSSMSENYLIEHNYFLCRGQQSRIKSPYG